MKKLFWMTLFGMGAAVLGGCPIYPDGGTQRVCDQYGCYNCPSNAYSGSTCTSFQCNADSDCGPGYVCDTQSNQCVSSGPGADGGNLPDATGGTCTSPLQCPTGENCGTDDKCHPGDCSSSGCPSGLVCKLSNGALTCVGPNTTGNDGGLPDASTDAGDNFTGCHNDAQCADGGAGAKCIDGVCIAAVDQCSDGTQCPNAERCVQGVCTPKCGPSQACPTGYSCDTNGVCTGDPTPCGAAGETCATGTTCVDQHCVPPCGAGDSCPTGLVCVDHGCIPDQKPQFVCQVEGKPGDGQVGDCATGSICLHHACYIACSIDAGADACKTAGQFNTCKSVTTGTGTYSVCGSDSNLGNQCDPTQGLACTSPMKPVCIDGTCY